MTTSSFPQLSDGAVTLFGIALKNDVDKQLTSNIVLKRVLEVVAELVSVDLRRAERMCTDAGGTEVQTSLFHYAALTLADVEATAIRAYGSSSEDKPRRSEWDHAALLALAQTMCLTGGMRNANNPQLEKAVDRWGRLDSLDLQIECIKNYFGNILQDYFDACEVRKNVRGLPPETEQALREQDAAKMAEWIRVEASTRNGLLDWQTFTDATARLATQVFLMGTQRQ